MNNLKQILESEKLYFGEANIAGILCTIGYKKEFRWTWFACQLNTFVIIGQATSDVDVQQIHDFSTACFEYALKNQKGWPRGLQSGVGSIAILCAENYSSSAAASCETLTKKHWSAFEVPVIYDITQKKMIRFKKAPMWGSLFFPYFAKMLDAIGGKLV